ncbi:MAG: FeoA domain-containing protein [Evtepia sp.]
MRTLRDAGVGQTVVVVRVHGEGALRRRIMDMGVTRGTTLQLTKVAPLGDPMEIAVRGYTLTLRKSDAELIEIELA